MVLLYLINHEFLVGQHLLVLCFQVHQACIKHENLKEKRALEILFPLMHHLCSVMPSRSCQTTPIGVAESTLKKEVS